MPGDRLNPALRLALGDENEETSCSLLRLVSKACREAVDSAATRTRLGFDKARRAAGQAAQCAAWLKPMANLLARTPHLEWVTCWNPSGEELEQLMAMAAARQPSAVAGVQRLDVHRRVGRELVMTAGVLRLLKAPGDEDNMLPALLRSLAHLPSLQVCAVGWPEALSLCVNKCNPGQVDCCGPCAYWGWGGGGSVGGGACRGWGNSVFATIGWR
jgi:hypothetical protein